MAKMSKEEKQLAKLQAKQDALLAKQQAREEKLRQEEELRQAKMDLKQAKKEGKGRKEKKAKKQKQVIEEPIEANEEEYVEKSSFLSRRKQHKEELSYAQFPELKKIKPYDGFVFHSDYFQVDDEFGCVMSFFHAEGAADEFAAFWGLLMLPRGLDNDITVHRFDQIKRMPQSWVDSHQNKSETVSDVSSNEQAAKGTARERGKARRRAHDLEVIGQELLNGAAYLKVSFRILVKAPTLEKLDRAIEHIDRVYKDSMGTVTAAVYFGEQRTELETMFGPIDEKPGKQFYFTSDELAGNYSLVTAGLVDTRGEYVGKMFGDVNNSAVVFDVDGFNHHVVLAGSGKAITLSKSNWGAGERGVSLWGSKIALSALMNNHKTVEFVLNGSKILNFCPDLSPITSVIGMDKGSINMFEMFGDEKDEMAIYAAQMQKLKLIAEQGYETTVEEKSIVQGSLEDVLTQFYVDNNMWAENAIANRDRLRVVNIPHVEVPRLREFSAYLNQRYETRAKAVTKDQEALHADNILHFLFRNMLTTNGDLFDCFTTDEIDNAKINRRVIYDFSSLARRGMNIVMAQFVNVLDFAIQTLNDGDVIVIYGAENISPSVMEYVETEFHHAYNKGVRIAWVYSSVDSMLKGQNMNHFDSADYTILGKMSANDAVAYKEALGQAIPMDLLNQLASVSDYSYYIRRGFTNVLFNADLMMGIDY